MKYEAIVFDKDGTLIDFNATWLPVYRYAAIEFANHNLALADALLGEHGFDHSAQRFKGGSLLAAGNNREITTAWSIQMALATEGEAFENHCQRLNQIFQQKGSEFATAVPELKNTIHQLKQSGLKLGVATSDSYAGIENTLKASGALPYFNFLCGYDSGHGVKPGPGMVQAFCRETSVAAEQTIVVGDNKHDIEMGRNAGVGLCVGVLTGTSTRQELEGIADIVYDDIRGLTRLFNQ